MSTRTSESAKAQMFPGKPSYSSAPEPGCNPFTDAELTVLYHVRPDAVPPALLNSGVHIPETGSSMPQHTGVVKWFNNAKGYGFIGYNEGPDVFVHFSSVIAEGYRTLKEGDAVTFGIVEGNKGRQADQVLLTTPGYDSHLDHDSFARHRLHSA